MRRNYRIFDRTLSSDLPLPELIQSPSSEADLRFTLAQGPGDGAAQRGESGAERSGWEDRKSTRLNSSHSQQSRMPSSA